MPAYALIRDAFSPADAEPEAREVVRISAASFDYVEAEHVYRIHAAYEAERVYSAAVAVPVR